MLIMFYTSAASQLVRRAHYLIQVGKTRSFLWRHWIEKIGMAMMLDRKNRDGH